MAKSRATLERTVAEIESEFDREMRLVRARRKAAIAEAKRKARVDAAVQRKATAQKRRKMAFELGEFLLKLGAGSALYEAVVGSPEFDEFMRDPRRLGRRELFGLGTGAGKRAA